MNLIIPSLTTLFVCAVLTSSAEEISLFENNVLFVPLVDSAIGAGSLQDVMVELSDTGELHLRGFREGQRVRFIEGVEIIQSEGFPVQVFLRVNALLTSGCEKPGRITRRVKESSIEVLMYLLNDPAIFDPDITCPAEVTPFTEIIQLPVYGLDIGEYNISVNGQAFGSFALSTSNSIQ